MDKSNKSDETINLGLESYLKIVDITDTSEVKTIINTRLTQINSIKEKD